ncbi:uncharacterized protein LOC113297583 isoform X3 [Papaver somniferum]|uniref:uncharacterized protein LOC113297583 isoform X3 n=1 Tax=Papaver somniferum TaxID=3469 RepID=UPI000E701D26|nr:uncharacterized protein LOC113297583 isoform X3 [Papaver somniferum]
MAAETVVVVPEEEEETLKKDITNLSFVKNENTKKTLSLSTYLGLSFSVFLGLLPKSSISLILSLQSRNRFLSLKLYQAEEQLKQMKSRRREDSKANARVVEIFASHRNGWQQEERKLLQQIENSSDEISSLRERIDEFEKSEAELRSFVEKLEREIYERDEMINFMSRQTIHDDEDGDEDEDVYVDDEDDEKEDDEVGGSGIYGRSFEEEVINGEFSELQCLNYSRFGKIRVSSEGLDPNSEEHFDQRDNDGRGEMGFVYGKQNGFINAPPRKVCADRAGGWQDAKYDSPEPLYHMKHVVSRESPWKADGEFTGVPAKLKLVEQELPNLERIDKCEPLKVSTSIRKQAKRYHALSGKIDDLCRRMQANDPSEQALNAEFRTRRQTEFLLEAYRLQQRAIETRQKLTTLQSETTNTHLGEDLDAHAKLSIRKSLDLIKNNFKEIQRNLEVWLARIMGELEGVLSREGASAAKEYFLSKFPSYVR